MAFRSTGTAPRSCSPLLAPWGRQPWHARACSLPLEDNGPRAAWAGPAAKAQGAAAMTLDLDQEFGPRKSRDEHQRGGRCRIGDVEVADAHVALQVLARDDEGIDANHVGEREGGFLEHGVDIAEAKVRLLLDGSRHVVIGRDAELAGADQNPVAGRDLHAVAVARERRPDPWRRHVSHGVHVRMTAWRLHG